LCYVPAIRSRHWSWRWLSWCRCWPSRSPPRSAPPFTIHDVTSTPSSTTLVTSSPRRSPTTLPPKPSREPTPPPWRPVGQPPAPNTPARSRRNRRPRPATTSRWVDDNGAPTGEPAPTTHAGVDAVTAALFMWAGVTAAAVLLLAGTRAVCDRIRAISWQHAIDTLVGRDGRKPASPKPAPIPQ